MKKESTKNYIDNEEFMAELIKWRDSHEDPDERQPSERLGQILLDLHDGILRHSNFRNYRPELKEEMRSYSIYRILKRGLKTFDFQKQSPFSYFSRAVFLNYYTTLSKYYKRMNKHQEYIKDCLMGLEQQGYANINDLLRAFRVGMEDDGKEKCSDREENN